MKSIFFILSVCLAGTAAFAAVPAVVDAAVKQMQADGAEVRAGFDKSLGVFVVASGTADITGSKAKAKTVARVNAVQRLGEFLDSQVAAASRHETSEATVNGQTEVKEFFSSVTEVQVRQLLKGVQDYGSDSDGDTVTAIVYLATKAQDRSAELKAAMNDMGDEGTVKAVGEGRTHDAAVQLALRSAVEQVVGTMVVGETAIKDNEAVRNKIFSGAEGFVDEYRITAEATETYGKRIEIVARVSKKRLLDSYRNYLKALGDSVFCIECASDDSDKEDVQVSARFAQFFRKLGFRISKTRDGATYLIKARGSYRRVKNPMDENEVFTQFSMSIKVLARGGEELLSLVNDPRKSAVSLGDPEREREICAEKAFRQMEKPVHEAINAMIARMMADHTDKFMNGDE
ncbi:MAG: hypothetical protein E7049_13320 [Lentisphaerae bacterium]|nr:hypothetical protein [Lentisphaerota bacterium]